jgi:leucyl aminopeptidase
MKVDIITGQLSEHKTDALIVYAFDDQHTSKPNNATQAVNDALDGMLYSIMERGDFGGKANETLVLYPQDGVKAVRLIVVGLGKADNFDAEVLRQAVGTGIKKARDLKAIQVTTVTAGTGRSDLSVGDSAQAIAEGATLALYDYQGQKSNQQKQPALSLQIMAYGDEDSGVIEDGVKRGMAFAEGSLLARELTNLPANICTPSYLAEQAQGLGEDLGIKVQVLERQQMKALKMGALLAVAQGSDTPPRFIIMEHNADKAKDLPTVVLVGKGVTFDTGGYSIKTRDGMVGMKSDMGGAAAVIGAMKTVAMLKTPLHVVGLVPSADNMINGKAYRPQDVIKASNGKTIEIISTDAEGRMLLADALVYAGRYEPDAVVDIATLTGGAVVALGDVASALFSRDDAVWNTLRQAGHNTQERVWRMPLYAEYQKQLESDTADMKNSGGRLASACTAATFLSNFVDYPWAHVDIAGMVNSDGRKSYVPKGASGFGARLLAEFAQLWAEK